MLRSNKTVDDVLNGPGFPNGSIPGGTLYTTEGIVDSEIDVNPNH